MLFRKLQLVLIFSLFGLSLAACGDSDSGSPSADKSQSMAPAATEESAMTEEAPIEVTSVAAIPEEAAPGESSSAGALEAYDPDVPSMVVEDNGVIHEEAIYKAWPEQAASTSESASAKKTEAPAPVATEAKTHIVNGRATSFSPNILFINPGDTVQWQSMASHDSVSMEGLIPEGAEPWAFKLGQNGAVTLTEEGVYIYKCIPHYPLGMVAAIIVGKPVNIEQVQANATGRAKGVVIKVVKALAAR